MKGSIIGSISGSLSDTLSVDSVGTFSGNQALICPDCGTALVNLAPNGERYHCSDCDLRLLREREAFRLVRFGEVVGQLPIEEVEVQVTWRALVSAV